MEKSEKKKEIKTDKEEIKKDKKTQNQKEKEKEEINPIELFIGKSYTKIGISLENSHEKILKNLLNSRSIPNDPLNQNTINFILNTISNMDSNNSPNHIGIGEREGRIISNIVLNRNFGLVHGMGRSGNINDLQPKAVGSSLLVQLTNSLTKNLLHSIGLNFINNILILPFATGMAITISFLTLRLLKPNAKYVIWSRIDQKTCFKCIITSGYIPIIINPIVDNGNNNKNDNIEYKNDNNENKDNDNKNNKNDFELKTDIESFKREIDKIGIDNILCIFSTTSCFAPRNYDDIITLSQICKEKNLFHIVNNAYGIYCTKVTDILNKSNKIGKVDLIISSTDKNFMVPVGGSLIYSSNYDLVEKVKKNYPGRASISPLLDLFISYLEMGKNKYLYLIKDRKEKYKKLIEKLKIITEKFEEKLLLPNDNKISIGITLGNIIKKAKVDNKKDITEIGSLFYNRQISGVRIITKSEKETEICGYKFKNYGCSTDDYKYLPYMTFVCAIGITEQEVDEFCIKFEKIINEYIKNKNK